MGVRVGWLVSIMSVTCCCWSVAISKVKMEYVGRLATPDGKEFDRSKPGRPLSFKLGTGEVLRKA